MAQTTLTIDLDSADKEYFEEFCKSTGLTVSVAVNTFIKAVLKKQRIPFAIEGDPFYSAENMARIRHAAQETEKGHYVIHEPIEVD